MTLKTHHISLLTSDVAQNELFYTSVLGLRFIKNSINQANPKMRHIYYGDFMGTPGTVVTFFPIEHLKDRVDGKMFFSGIHFSIPTGTSSFWQQRLIEHGFPVTVDGLGRLHTADPDQIPLRLQEVPGTLFDWHINYFSDISADSQITGVVGAELHVPDVEATGQFFEALLDLPVKGNVVSLDGVQAIELYETRKQAPESRFGRGSTDHYALAVESGADLLKYWDRAKTLGFKREVLIDRGYFRSVYFIEPGGNRVELATTNPGFTLDESLFDLGTTLALPPRFEAQREKIMAYFAERGVKFDEFKPYTGTGHLEADGKVRAIHDEQGNTRND
ncbi:VOC family protein [Weissella diestrammenae]|uniref:VOC family protein n=1 Tax=Weissella diestrammenae TaxID=1162633 RepID=A0A7G9T5X5_9LACO|nr:VOC family protein [Weissella diestrammenae]MCM0582330.1 VOC family protein [Weissella diestrammenae]QNN75500.1 VOC family protein [Weissella diestrammenae]